MSPCLTEPVNGIITETGESEGHYTSSVLVSVILFAFGLMAPLFKSLILADPEIFIATLGGVAMLRPLQGSFQTAFRGDLSIGGLLAFAVAVSGVSFFNIGAPFWGLAVGVAVAWAVETDKMRKMLSGN